MEGLNALREHEKACGKKCDPVQVSNANKASLEAIKKSRSEGLANFQKIWERAVRFAIFIVLLF